MKYNPKIHYRRSIRLKGYDYTQPGAYFITICTYQRMHVFGEVAHGEMTLNDAGKIAAEEWFKTAELRSHVKLNEDEFVIMPNHVHGIVWIEDHDHPVGALRGNAQARVRAEQCAAPTKTVVPGSLGAIVRVYLRSRMLLIPQKINAVPFYGKEIITTILFEMTVNCTILSGIFSTIHSTGNWTEITLKTLENYPHLKRWRNM